jgi:hypothetical protein
MLDADPKGVHVNRKGVHVNRKGVHVKKFKGLLFSNAAL